MLKTLEEPPPNSVLILIASSADLLLPTIRSRCQIVSFQPLSDGDPLPNYLYRDYGFLIWNAMHDYVLEIIRQIYKTDEGVRSDERLVALIDELYDPAMGNLPGERDQLDSIANLTEFIAGLMFTCSAGHSVVNFGQFDYYAFIPNRPLFMRRPMPDDERLVTMEYVMSALPDRDGTQEIIAMARTLTLLEPTSLLDDLRPQTGQISKTTAFPAATAKLYQRLADIDAVILTRNAQLQPTDGVEFPYFEPEKITTSVSI